jgi:arginine repressor
MIHEQVQQFIIERNIQSRDGIVEALNEAGLKVTRQGKNYLTITNIKGEKFRLKGALYEVESCESEIDRIREGVRQIEQELEQTNQSEQRINGGVAGRTRATEEELDELLQKVRDRSEKMAKANRKRYKAQPHYDVVLPSDSDRSDGLVSRKDKPELLTELPPISQEEKRVINHWLTRFQQRFSFLKLVFARVKKFFNRNREKEVLNEFVTPKKEYSFEL